MVVAVVVEVLVGGLEDPPVVGELDGLVGVLPEEQPVLVLDEELPGRPGLAPEVVEDGRQVQVQVGNRVEDLGGSLQIVAVEPEVRRDEAGVRVLQEHPVALGEQGLEIDLVGPVVPPTGEEGQLEPALVRVVGFLEEGRRFRGVDQHRDVHPSGHLPDRIQLRIVDLQP